MGEVLQRGSDGPAAHTSGDVRANDMQKIHCYGHVALEEAMGSDLHIVNNARVSFDQESDELGDNERGLINFLMCNKHGSPFEAPVFRFDIKAPIFVFREWMRHRIGSFNEQSARYSQIKGEWYVPARSHIRTQKGKPGHYVFETVEDEDLADDVQNMLEIMQRQAFSAYNFMLEKGVAKEVARIVLPVGTYSRMKWTVNLRSLLNFLALRNHEHAQREIRDYAKVVEEMVTSVVPSTMDSFNRNGRIPP